MDTFSSTCRSSLVDLASEFPPGAAIAKTLKESLVGHGYQVRDGLAWLQGLGHSLECRHSRWWITVLVGKIQDKDDLWLVAVYPNVNDTPFYVRWFSAPTKFTADVANLLTNSLRATDGITDLRWHDETAFKTRDFSKGDMNPVARRPTKSGR